MSSSGKEAFVEIVWMIPCSPHALAMAISPSGCASLAMAAGLTKKGALESRPRIFLLVRTSLTLRSTRGRSIRRLCTSALARSVTRSVAADE